MNDVVSVKEGSERPTSEIKQAGVTNAEIEKVELNGRKDFFALRKRWSSWIIGWITALVVFNVLLTIVVGLGWLSFLEYEWFIIAVTVETFLQVVGLGAIAAKFLFSSG